MENSQPKPSPLPSPLASPLAAGLVVGNYVVESLIGDGGMAQVYRVRHAVLGTRHALKVLDARYRGLPEVRQRFLSEGQIAAQLRHQHVVRVTDAVATSEVAGLVMELIEGPTLERYVAERGQPLSLAEVRELFLPVLDAIAEAHRRGIIHRDLKPANILLAEEHGRLIPKVTDFGIAKILQALPTDAGGVARGQTRADSRMGTLAYMSPEQVRGAKDVTAQSDVFSLGATLYELCTGDLAFDGQSDYEIMSDIVSGRLHKPALLDALAPVLGAAIRKALSVAPSDRFASCEEFALALMARPAQAASPRSGAGPAAAAHPPKPVAAEAANPAVRRCPMCNEVILASARKCKHCLEFIDPAVTRMKQVIQGLEQRKDQSAQQILQRHLTEKGQLPLKAAALSLVLPGLGQLLYDHHRIGGMILGGYFLLYAVGVPTGGIVVAHCLAAVLTALKPPRPKDKP